MKKEKINVKWTDGMSFEANVDGYKVQIDSDPEFGGQGKGPKPKPLMMVALAGCTGMDLISLMNKRGINAVVAVVLLVLLTIIIVTILWSGVLGLIGKNLDFSEIEARVEVVGAGVGARDARQEDRGASRLLDERRLRRQVRH